MKRLSLLASILLASCSVSSERTSMDCDPLDEWRTVADKSGDSVLVFGELHGVKEGPAAVAEYVCAVADADGPTLFAIEWYAFNDAPLKTVWGAAPEDFRATLDRELPDWNAGQDGRASEAMLAMLTRVHALKSERLDIDIVAFNGARDEEQEARFAHLPGQEPHEASQAENILIASQARDYAHVVVLVGNLHARRMPVTFSEPHWRPMVMHL